MVPAVHRRRRRCRRLKALGCVAEGEAEAEASSGETPEVPAPQTCDATSQEGAQTPALKPR